MAGASTTREPDIIIIPGKTRSQNDRQQQPQRKHRLLSGLLLILMFIALAHFVAVMHGAAPAASSANCQDLIRSTDYTQVVHLQPQSQQMEAVQFVNQLVGGQPAVLLQIINNGAQQLLDASIYGCSMQNHAPHLTQLLALHNLLQGAISISAADTLITSNLDTTLPPETMVLLQPQQQNIYREYAWQHGAFVQQAFPGLYPVTSRGEAEALQQQASSGQTLPWSDPLATAQQMARDLFKWNDGNMHATVLNNNGTVAQVQLTQQSPAVQVMVTLKRLIRHDSSGIWFVVSAQTEGITFSLAKTGTDKSGAIPSLNALRPPTTITGTGALAGGQTSAMLFDHTLSPLTSSGVPLNVGSNGAYSGPLSYTKIAPGQPGLLLLQSLPPNGSSQGGQLLLTNVYLT